MRKFPLLVLLISLIPGLRSSIDVASIRGVSEGFGVGFLSLPGTEIMKPFHHLIVLEIQLQPHDKT